MKKQLTFEIKYGKELIDSNTARKRISFIRVFITIWIKSIK